MKLGRNSVQVILSASLLTGCAGSNLDFNERDLNGEDQNLGGGGFKERTFANPPTPTPTVIIKNPVCDPFDTGNQGSDARNGLLSQEIVYVPAAQSGSIHNFASFFELDPMTNQSVPRYSIDREVIIHRVDVFSRQFSQGFFSMSDPTMALSIPGTDETLNEWFGMQYSANLRLPADRDEGLYEFMLIADDGSNLRIDTGSGLQTLIANDGVHAEKAKCSAVEKIVEMKRDSNFPIQLDYFQGPRYHIAMTLLWRRLDNAEVATHVADVECGKQANDYFFDSHTSTPKAPFNGLLNRGWEVVPADAFFLPGEDTTNPCL